MEGGGPLRLTHYNFLLTLPRFLTSVNRNTCIDPHLVENADSLNFLVKRTNVYCLSCKTVNTGENFWNGYCFAANQMRDKTAKQEPPNRSMD